MSRESREVRERFKRGSTENQGKVQRGSGEGPESQVSVDIESGWVQRKSGKGPKKVKRGPIESGEGLERVMRGSRKSLERPQRE